MTQALAAVDRSTPCHATQATTPVVLLDGVPEPALQAQRFTAALPMDARNALVTVNPAQTILSDAVAGKTIAVAIPHALSDNEIRWQVLLSGKAVHADNELAARHDRSAYTVHDRWAGLLTEPADTLSTQPPQALTLRDAMDRLGNLLQAEVVHACDPSLTQLPFDPADNTAQTLGSLLASLLETAGLRVQQTLRLERDQVRRTLVLLPERAGRRIALPWPNAQGRGGAVLKVDSETSQQPPRLWIALGDRPSAEDTFALVPGWDPALTGQADSDYARLTSNDFSRFGSVYRAWVLNEDGAFTDPPFEQGPAYDAGALFDTPAANNQPLRFGDCLAHDASGLAIAPVIESSTDNGTTWSAYPGQAQVMTDRAGVRLADDTLPTAILAAAKADTLRLRITASLTSPQRIEAQRWDGNPFAGQGPTRTLRLGDRFAWRRVLPTSIHAYAIAAGQLTADLADDRVALNSTLRQRLANAPDRSATAELAGAWTAIRVGDRVRDPIEPPRSIDASPSVFNTPDARIHQLQIDFGVATNTPRTRLRFD